MWKELIEDSEHDCYLILEDDVEFAEEFPSKLENLKEKLGTTDWDVVMLGISWNAANYSKLFIWLPGLVYGGLIGTQIVSVYENIAELGYLPKGLLYQIKDKIKNKNKK